MGRGKAETKVNVFLFLLWVLNKIQYDKTQDWDINEADWEKGKVAKGNWIRERKNAKILWQIQIVLEALKNKTRTVENVISDVEENFENFP